MSPTLAIVGGGLAGIAAAVEAVAHGHRVELFEQTRFLGGRASSLRDSKTGQWIDACPHVAMGCCTEFFDFCRRTDIVDCFAPAGPLHCIGPDGRQCDVAGCRWLPSPLHLLPAFLRLKYLSLGERWSIVRALHCLANRGGPQSHSLSEEEETIGAWLRRRGQSRQAVQGFWSVVLDSALGETVDHASLAAARHVFRQGFVASRRASEVWLPNRPLRRIFHDRLVAWLTTHAVQVHLGAAVQSVQGDVASGQTLVLHDGTRRSFERLVVAVPWHRAGRLLPSDSAAVANASRLQPAAITAVHLWFDRPTIPVSHAVLVGRLSQWVFADRGTREFCHVPEGERRPGCPHSDHLPKALGEAGHQHCQVVISASHRLAPRKHDAWLTDVCDELKSIWPTARSARLVHGRVIAQPKALFSMRPGVDRFRPSQQGAMANLALAGDWTATGWPATMEGAIRSGRLAVASLVGPRE
ncbi:MAG: hydroxysqualene dehydroxylase HpnE [Thermoguttaceae bacterium]